MRRKLLILAAATSAVLCSATGVLWLCGWQLEGFPPADGGFGSALSAVAPYAQPLCFLFAVAGIVLKLLASYPSYSGYDGRGNLKYLRGRPSDPGVWTTASPDAAPEGLEEALGLLCDAFGIPERQKHCLRPNDELMALYRSIVGPRRWDNLEFERLRLNLDDRLDPKLSNEDFDSLRTVGDVARAVAARWIRYCPTCGYDLRASPDRCPECGTAAPAKAAA